MSELDLAAIAARAAAATEAYSGIDLRKSLPTKGAIHERFMEVLADVPALLAEVERLTERAELEHRKFLRCLESENRAQDTLAKAEALVAEKDAEIERLADVAETNTAAYEYAVVERDEARAALADVTRERDDLRARVKALADEMNRRRWALDQGLQSTTDMETDIRALLDTTTTEEE